MKTKIQPEIHKTDILLISDNNLGLLGGERESQLIIINSLKTRFRFSVLQPGEYYDNNESVDFLWLTKKKRLKDLIKNPFAFVGYIFKVGKKIRELKPKVIHTNSQVSFFIVSLLMRFRLISRKIWFVHTDRGLYTKYNNFFRWIFKISFRYLDELITTTEFNKNCWEGANKKNNFHFRYRVIENTAGNNFENLDTDRIPTNDFLTIGFAGRMCDWKGWPLAERICYEVNLLDKTFHYSFCVSCLDESSKRKTEEMFARMKNVFGDRFSGRINVPFSEMEQFYYDVDFYILTSWPKSESFGRTIVEAMSRETVVLTTDAGGSVEVVGDGEMVHDKPSEFAAHIIGLKNNPDLLRKKKQSNLMRVRAFYSLKNNVNKYKELYSSFMEEEKR